MFEKWVGKMEFLTHMEYRVSYKWLYGLRDLQMIIFFHVELELLIGPRPTWTGRPGEAGPHGQR